ncbi:MAG: hemerythrin domain-containing protein [Oceanospirillaceae bacterium]
MILNYNLPEHDVSKRIKLPLSIQKSLLESTRTEWQSNPRFGGKANFFMTLHRDLLDGIAQLSHGIEQLLDAPYGEMHQLAKQMNLVPYSNNLIRFAHHHHKMEDLNYFPQMRIMHPELNHGFSLLDGDHNMVDAALTDIQQALRVLDEASATHDQLAKLYCGSKKLENIMTRHIWDEEEIIIPIFLKHT